MTGEDFYTPEYYAKLDRAAAYNYQQKAEAAPALHESALIGSEDVMRGFLDGLGGHDYDQHANRIRTGLYRIMMDFTDPGPYQEGVEIDMIHMHPIAAAFNFLRSIFEYNPERVVEEFELLAVSMEIMRRSYEMPDLGRQDARFGFLLAMVFEHGSVMGLKRPRSSESDQD